MATYAATYHSLTLQAINMRLGMALGRERAAISKITRSSSRGSLCFAESMDGGGQWRDAAVQHASTNELRHVLIRCFSELLAYAFDTSSCNVGYIIDSPFFPLAPSCTDSTQAVNLADSPEVRAEAAYHASRRCHSCYTGIKNKNCEDIQALSSFSMSSTHPPTVEGSRHWSDNSRAGAPVSPAATKKLAGLLYNEQIFTVGQTSPSTGVPGTSTDIPSRYLAYILIHIGLHSG
jgi:hypothetical protein